MTPVLRKEIQKSMNPSVFYSSFVCCKFPEELSIQKYCINQEKQHKETGNDPSGWHKSYSIVQFGKSGLCTEENKSDRLQIAFV